MTAITEFNLAAYLGFGYGWGDSWQSDDSGNLAAYVQSIAISWGRRSWFEDHRPAELTMTLSDPDRRFEPEWASGAYYPNVVPGVPVYLDFTLGSVHYPAFCGFAESWATRYPSGDPVGLVTVRATDGLAQLARTQVAASITGATGDVMVQDILDEVGWPLTLGGTAGQSTLTNYTVAIDALTACRLITHSEGGVLYALPEPWPESPGQIGSRILWKGRYANTTVSPSSAVTFSDNPSGDTANPYFFETLFEYDTDNIYNRAEITRAGGTTQVSTNAASIAAYGERTISRTGLLLATDNEALDQANWLVARHKDPKRYITLRTQIAVGGNNWEGGLPTALQMTNQIALIKRRPQGGTAFNEYVIIDGGEITHRRGGPVELTYYCRPFKWEQWWTLGSVLSSQLGVSTRLAW